MAPAQSPAWKRQFRCQFRKTKLCRFDAAGQCGFGSQCAFAHGADELQKVPSLRKTSMCVDWQRGTCLRKSSDCPFAHGDSELRLTPAFSCLGPSKRAPIVAESKVPAGKDTSAVAPAHGKVNERTICWHSMKSRSPGTAPATGPEEAIGNISSAPPGSLAAYTTAAAGIVAHDARIPSPWDSSYDSPAYLPIHGVMMQSVGNLPVLRFEL
mmetsp:Transcript_103842/g.293664  ORF Transcript_103842/g.293664 Transcript_103842/m.293664 type:complete len:211 (+) Transcript_103842:40-672(+)